MGVSNSVGKLQTASATSSAPNATDQQIIDYNPGLVDMFPIKGDNPEQILANAYNQSAYSEIARCTSAAGDGPLCATTMSMLIHSCSDNATRVSACNDPRLSNYQANLAH